MALGAGMVLVQRMFKYSSERPLEAAHSCRLHTTRLGKLAKLLLEGTKGSQSCKDPPTRVWSVRGTGLFQHDTDH